VGAVRLRKELERMNRPRAWCDAGSRQLLAAAEPSSVGSTAALVADNMAMEERKHTEESCDGNMQQGGKPHGVNNTSGKYT
jgi:hypothetical protein